MNFVWVDVALGMPDGTWKKETIDVALGDMGLCNEEIEALALDIAAMTFDNSGVEFIHVLQVEPDDYNT